METDLKDLRKIARHLGDKRLYWEANIVHDAIDELSALRATSVGVNVGANAGPASGTEASAIVDSHAVSSVFAAPAWAELSEDGKQWVRAIISETKRRSPDMSYDLEWWRKRAQWLSERTDALSAENARLREALAPFASALGKDERGWPDEADIGNSLTFGDLRRARAVLSNGTSD